MTAPRWDPAQYVRYADERSRPFHDLIARVAAEEPRRVVDLGCGDGALTASLADRWPTAHVHGIDTSPEMLGRAAAHASARLTFARADLRDWQPDEPIDVLVANAALQWVPDHVALFDRFLAGLGPGGWFAFQVPGNFDAPSHRLLAGLRLDRRWRDRVGDGADRHLAVATPAEYAAELAARGCDVEAWETTYLHLLAGDDPILEWVRGTGLRPVLTTLDDDDRATFEAEYGAALRAAYPARADGITPFPFRRVFVVARRSDRSAATPRAATGSRDR